MRDNNEGGSRTPGSAQSPASDAARPDQVAASGTGGRATGLAAPDNVDPELKPVTTDMHQFIGRQLRAVYDDVAKQPIPDRFLELMRQLDSKMESR